MTSIIWVMEVHSDCEIVVLAVHQYIVLRWSMYGWYLGLDHSDYESQVQSVLDHPVHSKQASHRWHAPNIHFTYDQGEYWVRENFPKYRARGRGKQWARESLPEERLRPWYMLAFIFIATILKMGFC